MYNQGRRNEGRAKGGNADGKGNFGLMNYIYKVVDVNSQISKPKNMRLCKARSRKSCPNISVRPVKDDSDEELYLITQK